MKLTSTETKENTKLGANVSLQQKYQSPKKAFSTFASKNPISRVDGGRK
jgi:hypothetical protein